LVRTKRNDPRVGNQIGEEMSKGIIAAIAIGGLMLFGVLFVGVFVLNYFSWVTDCNRQENAIKAVYTNNQNVYDNGWKQVTEQAQIPAMYADKLHDLAVDYAKGIKSEQQMFLMLQQQLPNVDSGLYHKIQQAIEAFRLKFEAHQADLVSQWQTYNNFLTATKKGILYNQVAGFVGGSYPHIKPEDFAIVTSDRTQDAFKKHKDDALQLYQPKEATR
jgi:hypothetical protein